jgi:hypothetical protein
MGQRVPMLVSIRVSHFGQRSPMHNPPDPSRLHLCENFVKAALQSANSSRGSRYGPMFFWMRTPVRRSPHKGWGKARTQPAYVTGVSTVRYWCLFVFPAEN